MDKIVYYNIQDKSDDNSTNQIVKISTIGFPVEETIEYDDGGDFTQDVNSLNINDSFKERINALVNDNNLMLILDLLSENDVYYNDEHNIKIKVESLEKVDDYNS